MQLIGIDVHLVLPHETAERRHVRHAGYGLQIVAQIPVLIAAQVRQALLAGGIDQGVLEYPSDAGGVRTQFGLDALRQTRQHGREVFERARARPVDIRAFVENDVDVGVAEVRKAAHVLHLRRAQHGGHDAGR